MFVVNLGLNVSILHVCMWWRRLQPFLRVIKVALKCPAQAAQREVICGKKFYHGRAFLLEGMEAFRCLATHSRARIPPNQSDSTQNEGAACWGSWWVVQSEKQNSTSNNDWHLTIWKTIHLHNLPSKSSMTLPSVTQPARHFFTWAIQTRIACTVCVSVCTHTHACVFNAPALSSILLREGPLSYKPQNKRSFLLSGSWLLIICLT